MTVGSEGQSTGQWITVRLQGFAFFLAWYSGTVALACVMGHLEKISGKRLGQGSLSFSTHNPFLPVQFCKTLVYWYIKKVYKSFIVKS